MTLEEIRNYYEELGRSREYGNFGAVERQLSPYRDVHAMVVLSILSKEKKENIMISCASHDHVWFNVQPEEIKEELTPELLLELYRCGLCYDAQTESFYKFV